MKNLIFFLIYLSLISLFACRATEKIIPGDPSTSLLEDSLDQWSAVGEAMWDMEGGVLTGKGGVGYIVSKKAYDDFILEAEFFPDAVVNSGIFVRCPSNDQSATGCYEVNIWDDHVNQEFRTGSIVTHGKPLAQVNSVGKWNQYKIIAKGNQVTVWLNGIKTADLRDAKSSHGFIALQVNGAGTIKFRNVRIRTL